MELICPACSSICNARDAQQELSTCPSCGTSLTLARKLINKEFSPQKEPDQSLSETGLMTEEFAVDLQPVTQVGSRLMGRYLVIRSLGKGAFGEVFLASDEKLNRDVALKTLRADKVASPAAFRRFVQEARMVAKLRHPGIVAVFDVCGDDESNTFISMEYVAGSTLSAVMADGPVSVDKSVFWVESIATAMHVAHKCSVIHRDLKPANIIIDELGCPRITDFGLALHEDGQYHHRGEVAGTLCYMAPEQVTGAAHHLDGRCDIWSLGCILYELLVGRPPFTGGRQQLTEEILHRPPRPPRQLNDTIPAEVEYICLRCLAKDVTERYATMLDVAEALRQTQCLTKSTSTNIQSAAGTSRAKSIPALSIGLLSVAALVAIFGTVIGNAIIGSPETSDNELVAGSLSAPSGPSSEVAATRAITAGRWYDLPFSGRPAEALAFTPVATAGFWSYSDDKREIAIDARTTTLIKLGATDAQDFKLQLTLAKSAYTGISGLAIGCQENLLSNGKSGLQYQTFVVNMMDPEQYYLEREFCELWFDSLGNPAVSTLGKEYVPILRERVGEMELQVTVAGDHVIGVRWQGRTIKELEDRNLRIDRVLPPCSGDYGVVNNFGAARFSNCRFMLTRSQQQ